MLALIKRLWAGRRDRRYLKAQSRAELTDRREAEHLERQRAGIRDVQRPGT